MMSQSTPVSLWQLFIIFLRLGCTSFGGPVAHLGYFRQEFVHKRQWINDAEYSSLVALCQFLPGPASSQVGLGLGLRFGGYTGALLAFTGFTLPSVLLMITFALYATDITAITGSSWLQGLKLVAVAIVIQAVWGMSKNFSHTRYTATITLITCAIVLLIPVLYIQVVCIVAAATVTLICPVHNDALQYDNAVSGTERIRAAENHHPAQDTSFNLTVPWLFLGVFFGLLLLLPLASDWLNRPELNLIDRFYRAGSLVFGGGHVVLPLLQNEVVTTGLVGKDTFLAGYGAAQAVPGPLFTFAAYLGAANQLGPDGWGGGLIAVTAIFLPAWLLLLGTLPLWWSLQHNQYMQRALPGINAAVTGLLLAALYDPVWTSTMHQTSDFLLVAFALLALMKWQVSPVWIVVCLPVVTNLM